MVHPTDAGLATGATGDSSSEAGQDRITEASSGSSAARRGGSLAEEFLGAVNPLAKAGLEFRVSPLVLQML